MIDHGAMLNSIALGLLALGGVRLFLADLSEILDQILKLLGKVKMSGALATAGPHPTGRWLVVKVVSGHECRVCEFLTELEYEAYAATYAVQRRTTRNRVRTVQKSLFPSIIFCRFKHDARCRIVSVPGVIGLAGSKWSQRIVDDADIDSVKRVLSSVRVIPGNHSIDTGEMIKFTRGPLAGIEGTVLGCEGTGHVITVSIPLLERRVVVKACLRGGVHCIRSTISARECFRIDPSS